MTSQMIIETIGKYWTTWLMGIIGTGVIALWRKVVKDHKEDVQKDKAIEQALMSILKDRIHQSCRFHLDHGEITSDELEILETMYKSYSSLGGNSVCTTLMEKIRRLNIVVHEIH